MPQSNSPKPPEFLRKVKELFRPPCTCILWGEPEVGKTTLLAHLCRHFWRDCLYFALDQQLDPRLDSGRKFQKLIGKDNYIYIDLSQFRPATIAGITNQCLYPILRQMIVERNPDVVVLDSITAIFYRLSEFYGLEDPRPTRITSRFVSTFLHWAFRWAKETEGIVIVVAHHTREFDTRSRRARFCDIARNVLMLDLHLVGQRDETTGLIKKRKLLVVMSRYDVPYREIEIGELK